MIDSAIFGSDIVEVDSLHNAIYPTLTAGPVREDSRQGGSIGSLFSDAHTHYRHVDSPKMLEGMADHDSLVLL